MGAVVAPSSRSGRNLVDRREGLDIGDSGSATSLAIIVVETDRVLSMSEGELMWGSERDTGGSLAL
jgi:hypothetical protein